MKNLVSFIFITLLSTSIFAQTTWKADPAHSQVSFGVVHNGISEVEGVFDSFEATIVSSEEDFSDAVFTVTIDVASIDTQIEMRDDHLRSADFFNVEKFADMTFKSTSIKRVSENKYKLAGELTLHGITKPITLDVWYRGTIEQKEDLVAGFQITGTLDRSEYEVGTKFPASMLSDEVAIKVDAEFKKQ